MKLRFRSNSVRLRVNRREVESILNGSGLSEHVHFPGETQLAYVLEKAEGSVPQVEFANGVIRVAVPESRIADWALSDDVGMYFEIPANGNALKVAIEKDLECVDG